MKHPHAAPPKPGLPDNRPSRALMSNFERAYVLGACLYYAPERAGGEGSTPSPMTDHDWDGVVHFLEYWRPLVLPELIERAGGGDLKAGAHAIDFTDDERAAAELWAMLGTHWPPT